MKLIKSDVLLRETLFEPFKVHGSLITFAAKITREIRTRASFLKISLANERQKLKTSSKLFV